MRLRARALASAFVLASPLWLAVPSFAERVLRLDEAPVGEVDPAKATDYADTVLMTNIYDTLVYPKAGGPGVEPLLATEWTTDGKSYTFKLKDGVKFHSGNPLTADDVVFSLNRMIAMGQGFSNLFAGRVEKAEAVDPLTVKFTLTEPYAPFLAALVRLPIVDAKTVMANKVDGKYGEFGDYGEAWLSAHDAGSGAYKVESQNPQSETVMVKFPDYFLGFAENAPDKVRYRYGLEAPTVRALMSRGEHDIADLWLPPEVIRSLAAEKGIKLDTEAGGATGEYIKLNTARAPLDDVHCRLALTYAFDYDTTLKILKINDERAQGIPMKGPLPSGLLGYDKDLPDYKQDMDKAKEELAKCKYDPKSSPLDIAWIAEVPARERIALLMQAQFSKLGFPVKVIKTPWALVSEQVTKPETAPHAVEIAVAAVTPDPDSLLYNMYSSKVPPTWMSAEHLKDAKVDELLEAGRTETDPAKREAIYKELNKTLRDLAPAINAYEFTGVYTARDVVALPKLEDKSKQTLDNFNLLFREMSITE
ncbi:ABC transporter substrate-binding protein [Kaistia geumhonensis]|uniref:Peptide/nickel transport system substrate-binding protein n=1 Tax=Kaistia geumhonensis TaxID=410839 RepID=A0ABU0M1M8_9HYPH|nr:ABC transporter substrate-binding protein [Kaistia geumhonensis]MCX5479920.1 ABC transporter substrate-binding protein [Kaistia geumhonensis]MDQ0514853.1 peptide/nickel transport system substrate-binding protein [Kaistia geumhonensis]